MAITADRMITAEERARSQGVGTVSAALLGKVTQYHAQIGSSVPMAALRDLERHLTDEGTVLYRRGQFEDALNTFTHALAITDKTDGTAGVRGAIVHNIASCLHQLGEVEAAQVYYQQAIHAFEAGATSTKLIDKIDKVINGNINQKRADFVKDRFIDIAWGRKPDTNKYLDSQGRKKTTELQDAIGNQIHGPAPGLALMSNVAAMRPGSGMGKPQGYERTADDNDDEML